MASGWSYQPAPAAANAFVPDRELSAVLAPELHAGNRCAVRVPESFHRNLRPRLSSHVQKFVRLAGLCGREAPKGFWMQLKNDAVQESPGKAEIAMLMVSPV